MPPPWGYLRAVKEMTKNTTLLDKQNQLHPPTALQTPAIRGVKFPPQPSAFSGQAAFAAWAKNLRRSLSVVETRGLLVTKQNLAAEPRRGGMCVIQTKPSR
ncbi:MAG: hypothetical protein C0424_06015 [Sphingobacteriaceae bacterium]|nr:hypothetical protein [Sphingobacteriaceae bacterium]